MPVILRDTGSINVWLTDASAKLETILGPCDDPDLVSASNYSIFYWMLNWKSEDILCLSSDRNL